MTARSEGKLQLVSLEDDPAHRAVGQLGDPWRGISLRQTPQLIDVLLGPASSHPLPLSRNLLSRKSREKIESSWEVQPLAICPGYHYRRKGYYKMR